MSLRPLLFFSSRVTETHQLAELNEKKNERLRAAFGISDSYVDGSSFDPQRRAREAKQPAPEPPKPYRYIRPVIIFHNSKHSVSSSSFFLSCGGRLCSSQIL